jgi:hypothetical protein
VGTKPTLLKPGAEKLSAWFNLSPRLKLAESILDWTGEDHGGEPLFYFRYYCSLFDDRDYIVGESYGSANSWETKYRYRWVKEEDVPENLHLVDLKRRVSVFEEWEFALNKRETTGKYGKPESYWQKFDLALAAGEARQIEKPASWDNNKLTPKIQIVDYMYRVANSESPDIINTVEKMAMKRAFVGSVLIGTQASVAFTQDLEELGELQEWRPGWSEFYTKVIPAIPNLMGGARSREQEVTVLSGLMKDKYDLEQWDSALASSAMEYLIKLNEEAGESSD